MYLTVLMLFFGMLLSGLTLWDHWCSLVGWSVLCEADDDLCDVVPRAVSAASSW